MSQRPRVASRVLWYIQYILQADINIIVIVLLFGNS